MKLEKTAPKPGNVTMNNGWTWPVLVIGIIVFILGMCALAVNASGVTINDGDTVVITGEKIRLWGIDAPESDQPYGQAATMALTAAVMNAGPALRIERLGKDKYGRTIARLHNGRKSINAAMVEGGHAWAYVFYSATYEPHQHRAYTAGLGLWKKGTCPPIAPWLWRRGYR